MSTEEALKQTNTNSRPNIAAQPHSAPQDQLESVSLISWNLWFGGLMMNDGQSKQIDYLRNRLSDIICLQESVQVAAAVIAGELGYGIAQQGADTAVISRYPLELLPTSTYPYATAARVNLPDGPILVWSVHLEHTDYGPYRASQLPAAAAEIFGQRGEQLRDQQAAEILAETERLEADLPDETPVIIAGDFNVPSPEDWNGGIRPKAVWPATARIIDAGYLDAFRAVHPDPETAPGLTWSQIHTHEDEPRDRIDFVFVDGMAVRDCWHEGQAPEAEGEEGLRTTGSSAEYIPNHRDNDFPSDHLAVHSVLKR